MTMEILKTTVGHALKQLFPENVAFTIASFLVEDPEEQKRKTQTTMRNTLRKNDEREENEIL